MHSPVELVYVEEVEDHIAALKREAQIKKLGHARKVRLAEENLVSEEFSTQDQL
jgi:predicted GIY-YIG superfamily endonuclease